MSTRPWSQIKRKGNVNDPLRIMRIHAHRARLLLMMAGWW